MPWPAAIYPSAEVRAIDARAIEDCRIPGYTLMTRAGEAALAHIQQRYGERIPLLVVTGAGNNGGDGFVVARLARSAGHAVQLVALVDPDKLGGDAARAAADWRAGGGRSQAELDAALASDAVIVDAILGSGISRDVDGRFAEVIGALNGSGQPIVALDIPSGLDGDTGEIRGVAIRAQSTVTFVAHKAGLWLGAGPGCSGPVTLATLGIPAVAAAQARPLARLLTATERPAVPERRRDHHKGQAGHVLVVGGNAGMPGAALLTATAALRSGAGLVTVATRPRHAVPMAMARPELMCRGVDSGPELETLLRRADVVAIGPGLGTDEWAGSLLATVLEAGLPAVVDADALNCLAEQPRRSVSWILTPHPGEAARLLRTSTAAVQHDRLAAAGTLVERYGGVAVLKGVGSIVACTEALPAVAESGTPAMAAPGMGDALTGIIAALVAQGMSLADAAEAGVFAHGRAGETAARGHSRGLVASDLIDALPSQWN